MFKFKINQFDYMIDDNKIVNIDCYSYDYEILNYLYNKYDNDYLEKIEIKNNRFIIFHNKYIRIYYVENIFIYNGYFYECDTEEEKMQMKRLIKLQKINGKN